MRRLAACEPDTYRSASGIRTRRSELVHAGYVRDSGHRATLPTGRKAIVWEITLAGRTWLENDAM